MRILVGLAGKGRQGWECRAGRRGESGVCAVAAEVAGQRRIELAERIAVERLPGIRTSIVAPRLVGGEGEGGIGARLPHQLAAKLMRTKALAVPAAEQVLIVAVVVMVVAG